MIPILLATAVTCADIDELILRARNYPDIDEIARQDIIDLYQNDFAKSIGIECEWDANG